MNEQVRQDLERYGSWERMTSGEWFLPSMPEAKEEHQRTFRLVKQLNELQNTDQVRAEGILREILPEESAVPGLHVPAQPGVWLQSRMRRARLH